jgi:hypothetical protein
MSYDPQQVAPLFHIDVTADTRTPSPLTGIDKQDLVIGLLQQLAIGQQRQNELLEELVQQASAAQKQRGAELSQWKQSNPDLSRRCRAAAEVLNRVHAEFLRTLTEEVADSEDALLEGDFMLNEFVDRFGPRLAHLSGVLQVLSALSLTSNTAPST